MPQKIETQFCRVPMPDQHMSQTAPPTYSTLFETPVPHTTRYSFKILSQLDLIPYLPDHICPTIQDNEYHTSVGVLDISKLLSTAKANMESEMTLRAQKENRQKWTRRVEYDVPASSHLLRRCIVKYFAKPDGSIQLIDLRWHFVLRLEE